MLCIEPKGRSVAERTALRVFELAIMAFNGDEKSSSVIFSSLLVFTSSSVHCLTTILTLFPTYISYKSLRVLYISLDFLSLNNKTLKTCLKVSDKVKSKLTRNVWILWIALGLELKSVYLSSQCLP